jgi:hypothetical protein
MKNSAFRAARWRLAGVLAALVVLGVALPDVSLAETPMPQLPPPPSDWPKGAQPVDPGEIAHLFQGKTWKWPDGAGFFGDPRKFQAYTGEGRDGSFAAGRWLVTQRGTLCMQADWISLGSKKTVVDCFEHVQVGNAILEHKAGSAGNWYPLITTPPQPGDEARNLVAGDQVSKAAQVIEQALKPGAR